MYLPCYYTTKAYNCQYILRKKEIAKQPFAFLKKKNPKGFLFVLSFFYSELQVHGAAPEVLRFTIT